MRMYRRIGMVAVAGVAALGLAACGSDGTATTGGTRAAAAGLGAAVDLSAETQALAALGFQATDLAPAGYVAADASPSARPGRPHAKRKRPLNRVLIRRHTLHGEVVVQTKEGTRTLQVQRGEVTAIDDKTITVKSSDGYTLTWTFGQPIRVVEHRTTVQPKDLGVGAKVGVAGTKDGDTSTAKLIVVPAK